MAIFCFNNAKLTILICAIVILALGSQVVKVKVDISTEACFVRMIQLELTIRNSGKLLVGRCHYSFNSDKGSLDKAVLERIHKLQVAVESRVPYIDKITSLINARYTYGEDDELIVEDLLEGYPNHKWNDAELLEHVLTQPAYINRLISKDGEFLAMVLELQTYAPGTEDLLGESKVLKFMRPYEICG